MSDINIDKHNMKALRKAVVLEIVEENEDFVRKVLRDILEDTAMTHAIEEGKQTSPISRDEIAKLSTLIS